MLAARHGHGRVPNTMSTHIRLVRAHAFDDAARPSVFHWCLVVSRFQWHNSSGVARILSGIGFPTWPRLMPGGRCPRLQRPLGAQAQVLKSQFGVLHAKHNASDLDAMHIGLRNLQTFPVSRDQGQQHCEGQPSSLEAPCFSSFQRTQPMQLRTVKRVKLDGGEFLDQSLELCADADAHNMQLVLGRGARMLGSIRPNLNAQILHTVIGLNISEVWHMTNDPFSSLSTQRVCEREFL